MVAVMTTTPRLSRGATSSIIARMTMGTPAITKTLPIRNPGAVETLFLIRLAPSGTRAMRWRISLNSPG